MIIATKLYFADDVEWEELVAMGAPQKNNIEGMMYSVGKDDWVMEEYRRRVVKKWQARVVKGDDMRWL